MYQYHLEEMTETLAKLKVKDHASILKALKKYWEDKIAITWTTDDVKAVAKQMHKRISTEKARQVLDSLLHHHDANQGISWETIRTELEMGV